MRGYRAATFSVGAATPWAWPLLEEEGYRYSSSIYPVARDNYSNPDAPRSVYKPAGTKSLIEVPIATVRVGSKNYPAGGGGYFVDDYWWGYGADMFRYSAPGVLDWTFGTSSYFSLDGGVTPYLDGYFSTGEVYGDGWQASHWKNPGACVDFRGIMNPYICNGVGDSVSALDLALFDVARPGRPRAYDTDVEAQVTALACSAPPEGRKRWTMVELERAARREPGLGNLSRETVRRMLKKTISSPGGG